MNTSELAEQRWVEVQFYQICTDLLQLNHNPMDVMEFIDALAFLGEYDAEFLKSVAQEVMQSIRIQPSRNEVCILSHKHHTPVSDIKRILNIHNKTLYIILEHEKENPDYFYPRLDKPKIQEIEKFLNTYKKLKKVGFNNEQ